MKCSLGRPLALIGLLATIAGAQVAPPGMAAGPGGTPAPPDTAVARFGWADEGPEPVALHVLPTDATFGDPVILVLDLAPEDGDLAPDSLLVDVPWLEPSAAMPPVDLAELPASDGPRLTFPFHVYRVGPWRAAWSQGEPGSLLAVQGRVTDPNQVSPVRDPRRLGGVPFWVLILVGMAILALAGVLVWSRWRGRRAADWPSDRPLPPFAWVEAAPALEELAAMPHAGPDSGRAYLDRLTGILRRYLAVRFQLPAEEMTPAEIGAAGHLAGWPAAPLQGFVKLLQRCDADRYAPGPVAAHRCRASLDEALDLIEAVRILPRYTPVAAEATAAAEVAWRQLRTRGGVAC